MKIHSFDQLTSVRTKFNCVFTKFDCTILKKKKPPIRESLGDEIVTVETFEKMRKRNEKTVRFLRRVLGDHVDSTAVASGDRDIDFNNNDVSETKLAGGRVPADFHDPRACVGGRHAR